MKNYKRILSLLLALSLFVGLIPMSIFAEGNTKSIETQSSGEYIEIEEAVASKEEIPEAKEEIEQEIIQDTEQAPEEKEEKEEKTKQIEEDISDETDSWDDYVENNIEEFEKLYSNEILNKDTSRELPVNIVDMSGKMISTFNLSRDTGNSDITRHTILVFDTSGSMSGTPINKAKEAAIKFVDQILDAEGDNYVALISFASTASLRSDFTNDKNALHTSINKLHATGGTNQAAALALANELLETQADNSIKNIVLLSDGLPQTGERSNEGPYKSTDYNSYSYANAAYNKAQNLHSQYFIYSLGFFHNLSGSNLRFGRRFMTDLQNAGYYDVVNVEELDFVFGEIAHDIIKKSGTFRYPAGDRDHSSVYYYDDKYFSETSYKYNNSLATMSLCLELSAWASADVGGSYENKSINAQNLLTEIGFSDFETNHWFTKKPTKDSIGVVAANKKITVNQDEYTLIALAVRGGGYEREWASNFKIGESGFHTGFTEARDQVLDFLEGYITDNNVSGDVKLWVTGFSRGAATANMVAGAIDDGRIFNNIKIEPENLYAYTFETPAGAQMSAVNKKVYKNIFNIINENDLVTKVGPVEWEFARYGEDKILPNMLGTGEDDYAEVKPKMLKHLAEFEKDIEYTIEDFKMKKIKINPSKVLPGGDPFFEIVVDSKNKQSQSAFLDDYINKRLIAEFVKTRPNYVANYQDPLREFLGIFFGAENEKTEKLISVAKNKFKENWKEILKPFIFKNPFKPQEKEIAAYKVVARLLRESLDAADIKYDKKTFDEATVVISDLLVALVTNHPNLASTLATNIDGIGSAHYPELCLAWLQSMDKNYTSGGKEYFTNGSYRIVRINCPVDVEVYNDKNKLVAKIESDQPIDVGSSIISSINEDGEKIVYLPAVGDYDINIIPTDSGLMSLSISEYNRKLADTDRIVNYFDIPISLGEGLTAKIPSFTKDESTAAYDLSDSSGDSITPNSNIVGDEAIAADFTVELSIEDDVSGFVSGQGIRQYGSYAQIEAIPNKGYVFDGWYKEGQNISRELTYRFRVEEDVKLVAKFTPNSYEFNISSGAGGFITKGSKGQYDAGTFIDIAATPAPGYRFVEWSSSNGGIFKDAKSKDTIFAMAGDDTSVLASFESIEDSSNKDSSSNKGSSNNRGGSKNKNSLSWDSILDQILLAKDGDTIDIDIKDNTQIPGSILNSIKDKNIKIAFKLGAYKWLINGKDIKEAVEDKSSYNLEIKAVKDFNLSKSLEDITINNFEFINDDVFPFTTVLEWNIGKEYSGKNVFIGKYDDILGDLEFIDTLLVDEYGNISNTFDTIGKYIITTIIPEGAYVKYTPKKSDLYSYVPYLRENNKKTLIKFSPIVNDSVTFYAPKNGLYEYANNKKTFTDSADHWASNAIEFIGSRELFLGLGNNEFKPNDGMTRAMFATVLSRLDGVDLTNYNISAYSDVNIETWYGPSVSWAADKGIIAGYGDELFGPEDLITREQMALMLNNYIKFKDLKLSKFESDSFNDIDKVSNWAKESVSEMKDYNLITGVGNNIYSPKQTATRASVAQIFMNMINCKRQSIR